MSAKEPSSILGKQWTSPATEGDLQAALSLGLPEPVASVLAERGLATTAEIARFIAPLAAKLTDPTTVSSIYRAAGRISAAIDKKEEMVVFGDFDADGVVASATLCDMVTHMGGRIRHFLPDRNQEGYGLSEATLQRCFSPGYPRLFITVDCGMGSGELLAAIGRQGVDLIVTDHHTPSGELPPACIVVNPHLADFPDSMRYLCGAGVAFQVANAIVRIRGNTEPDRMRLAQWLDAAALATVADVVPLSGDNRTLVAHGLRRLDRSPRPGLAALLEVGGVAADTSVDSYHLGFVLGPRINAAGRMGSAEAAFELLLSNCENETRELAQKLNAANQARKTRENEILESASRQLDEYFDPRTHGAVVVGDESWHPGVNGIVAARLMEFHRRPAAVITLDEDGGRGSARSVEGCDMVAALAECSGLLKKSGGHKFAAGFSLEKGAFEDFRQAFARACHRQLGAPSIKPKLKIDYWLSGSDVNSELMDGIDKLKPFGESNPSPCWGLSGVDLAMEPQPIGQNKDHLRLSFKLENDRYLAAVWFRSGEHLPRLLEHTGKVDVAGELQLNEFNGSASIQLLVRDIRLH